MSFSLNLSDNYGEKLMHIATKRELDAAKTASKKEVHETAEVTGELIVNKIAKSCGNKTYA